jgi:small subunit ribosomal protein S2
MSLGGIKDMGGLPDIVFVLDTNKDSIAVAEANKLGIPVIGVLDSNSSPIGVDYPIPGNDDSTRSITFYCDMIAGSVLSGIQTEMSTSGIDIGELDNPLSEELPVDGVDDKAVNIEKVEEKVEEKIEEKVEEKVDNSGRNTENAPSKA